MSSRRLILLTTILCCWGSWYLTLAQTTPSPRGVTLTPQTANPSTLEDPGPYHALVIGINDYSHLRKLETAVNDATQVAQVLQDEYGFKTELLRKPTRHDIIGALDEYGRSLPEKSNLLIFYAGHGHHDRDTDKAYWLPADAESGNRANWISADDITDEVRSIQARHILVVSDSCYSGALGRSKEEDSVPLTPSQRANLLEKSLKEKSRRLMTSGGDEPVADGGAPGHSIFSYALLRGLTHMEENAFVARELYNQWVYEYVGGKSGQTPQFDPIHNSGHEDGDFVFFRREAQTRTAERDRDVGATSKPSTAEQAGPYYALAIGIDGYRFLPKLGTAVNDANDFARALRERYGFKTTVLFNATRHDILSQLDNYQQTLQPDANLLIYYAGQSYSDREEGRAYWAPVEAERDTRANWISGDEITSSVRGIQARHILIVADGCCSMEPTTRGDISPTIADRVLYLEKVQRRESRAMMSSGGSEPMEDPAAPGHSVFTNALLQELAEIEYEEFTAAELFERVLPQVHKKSDSAPAYGVVHNSRDDFGDFVFLRLPASTKARAGGGGAGVSPLHVGSR